MNSNLEEVAGIEISPARRGSGVDEFEGIPVDGVPDVDLTMFGFELLPVYGDLRMGVWFGVELGRQTKTPLANGLVRPADLRLESAVRQAGVKQKRGPAPAVVDVSSRENICSSRAYLTLPSSILGPPKSMLGSAPHTLCLTLSSLVVDNSPVNHRFQISLR